jgi:hypothetical protein
MRIPSGELIPDGGGGGGYEGCGTILFGGALLLALVGFIADTFRPEPALPSRVEVVSSSRSSATNNTVPSRGSAAVTTTCAPEPFWKSVVGFIDSAREAAAAAPQQTPYETSSEFADRRKPWDSELRTQLDSLGESAGVLTLEMAVTKQEYFPEFEQLRLMSGERVPIPPGISCEVGPVLTCHSPPFQPGRFLSINSNRLVALPRDVAREWDVVNRPLSVHIDLRLGTGALVGGPVQRIAPAIFATNVTLTSKGANIIDLGPASRNLLIERYAWRFDLRDLQTSATYSAQRCAQ